MAKIIQIISGKNDFLVVLDEDGDMWRQDQEWNGNYYANIWIQISPPNLKEE